MPALSFGKRQLDACCLRVPATRSAEVRLALVVASSRGLREQVALAQPGHRALQGGAVVMNRDRSVMSFGALHDAHGEAFEVRLCFESVDVN